MLELTNTDQEPTGAIFGVVNMLRKLLKAEQPDYFAVVFDAKGKSFRNDIYPEHKANRPPAPPDLVAQIRPLHEIIRALGCEHQDLVLQSWRMKHEEDSFW